MTTVDATTRVQVKSILFATDFSPASRAAATYAASLAKHYKATIYAFHVRPPVVNPMTPPNFWKSLEEGAAVIAEQRTKELVNTFAGIHTKVIIKDGDLWSNFEAAVDKNKIDLIVMGTRGRSGVDKLLLGSIAEEMFRKVSCPVLTVGPYSNASRDETGEFTRILFATDFNPGADAAAPYAVSLAQEYQAHLTLLHVIAEQKVGDLVNAPELASSCSNLLRILVPSAALLWCDPEYIVETGKAADKILETASLREADLIVLGLRPPKGIPGAAEHLPIATAHKVVSEASCPVLTVRG